MRSSSHQLALLPLTVTALRPKKKYSTEAFYSSISIIYLLAVWSLAFRGGEHHGSRDSLLRLRDTTNATINRRDLECRLVHTVSNQCEFVRANCLDEEVGLFSYLQLYYCILPDAKPLAFAILALWLGLLFSTIGIAASDFFCINLSTISTILGMSESMAGATFLAFGNGSPDVFSTFAAMSTHSGSLAIGELIGAAGFITGVVAGSMALVRPFKVARKSFVRDVSFFIVATSFSLLFLADGKLAMWECAVMVAFYIFYVLTVMIWHWVLGRRRKRREREILARSHFRMPEEVLLDADEELPQDGDMDGSERVSRRGTIEDFNALERGGALFDDDSDDDEDDTQDRWLARLTRNMRISHPQSGERRNTGNPPIRPSLVGALEFRAILSSLQKARNQQTPISLRRYSDDPNFIIAQQQHSPSNDSIPIADPLLNASFDLVANDGWRHRGKGDQNRVRTRAVSANDVDGLLLQTNVLLRPAIPQPDLLGPALPSTAGLQVPTLHLGNENGMSKSKDTTSPSLFLLPLGASNMNTAESAATPKPNQNTWLVPPGGAAPPFTGQAQSPIGRPESDLGSPIRMFNRQNSDRSMGNYSGTAGSSPAVPFPQYYDDPALSRDSSRASSLRLPPPGMSLASLLGHETANFPFKPIHWWPHKFFPSPRILFRTLFPTLIYWEDKNVFEKLLGIVAAPSVFLLTITLPVVETDKVDERTGSTVTEPSQCIAKGLSPEPRSNLAASGHDDSDSRYMASSVPEVREPIQEDTANSSEEDRVRGDRSNSHLAITRQPLERHGNISIEPTLSSGGWNRWLVSTQVFTAPFFVVLIVWANTDPDLSIRALLVSTAYALIASLVVFAMILLTTSEAKPPRYRYALCFLGFIVSIAWISTIANEVVGLLKAFGAILGISDAILGLTIFAVGNSLGDLVADITVARLGFPVMALSACFGGPMLNILLGVGLSGLYMTISNGKNGSEAYHIEVGRTLIVSGITLLVTLVGLLVVVPLNRWVMDRKIGWGLVTLWSLSTIGNLVIETTGLGGDLA